MPNLPIENLRTVAFVGHGHAGKTSLIEAILHATGAIAAKGSIERGTTQCDFDPLEKELGHSIQGAITHTMWNGLELNLLDTPGFPDFAGHALPVLAAADMAVVVINAQAGIELNADRMMRAAEARGICRMVVVNKIDAPNLDLAGLVASIRDKWGARCMMLDLPAHGGKDVVEVIDHDDGDADVDDVHEAHRSLVEQLVEEDKSLLARYLDTGKEPGPDELHAPFEQALREGHLVPIVFTSARTGVGVPELVHILATLGPNPSEVNPPPFTRTAGELERPVRAVPDPERHTIAHVFKVHIDPYLGKVSTFRVYQGTLTRDMVLNVGDGSRTVKVAHLYKLRGKEYVEVEELEPGEIGAVAKVDEIDRDAVLHNYPEAPHLHLRPLDLPKPMHGVAVEAKQASDEQRMMEVLGKVAVEDPCIRVERHAGMHETVLFGLGELHLRVTMLKLRTRYGLELTTRPPRIPYKETIARSAEGHWRHKKQTGGAGQFGEVYLRVESLARGSGVQFVDAVKGGVIPNVFIPAVEKGVRKALADGAVAGFPVEDVRITLYDGKTHPVDGKEIAFVTAGRKATLTALREAGPIVLEPIVAIEITAPSDSFGAIAGDLSTRRGHVTGSMPTGAGTVVVEGMVPLAELPDYGSRLSAMTGGSGSWTVRESHYAPVTPPVQAKLAEAWGGAEEETDA